MTSTQNKIKELIINDRKTTKEEKEQSQSLEPFNLRITTVEVSGDGAKLTSEELAGILKLFTENKTGSKTPL